MPGESKISSLRRSRVSFSTWNINGLDDSVLSDKLDNLDFLNHVNKFDFIVLTETWTRRKVFVPDYNCFNSIDAQRSNSSKGRSSGGIVILYKIYLAHHVAKSKVSHNFIWCKLDKSLMGTEEHVYVCGAYNGYIPTRKL